MAWNNAGMATNNNGMLEFFWIAQDTTKVNIGYLWHKYQLNGVWQADAPLGTANYELVNDAQIGVSKDANGRLTVIAWGVVNGRVTMQQVASNGVGGWTTWVSL